MQDTHVPVIDISSFLDRTDIDTPAREIDRAATNIGFFQIVGHGVSMTLLDAVYRQAEALNREPEDVRSNLASPTGHPYRGMTTNTDKRGIVCSSRFHVNKFENAEDAIMHGVDRDLAEYFVPNIWPSIPGFRDEIDALFLRTQWLGLELMRLFAVALKLPLDYFDSSAALNASNLALNYYPASHAPVEESPTIIFDEHFDSGTLTILHQRGTYEGLEIRTPSGDWAPVPVIPEAFVINMGELMTRWTNDRWPATRHRVIAADDPEGHRTTIATFYNPAVDTVIAPLPVNELADGPRYEPVSVHAWEKHFLKKVYKERKFVTPDEQTLKYIASLG